MSYSIGHDALLLRPTPRLAHTEYCSSAPLIRQVQGATGNSFEDAWDIDFLWCTNDGPIPWAQRGRVTDMGHAEFLEGGIDLRQPKPSPFHSEHDVWAFDAVAEYGLPDLGDLTRFYESWYGQASKEHPQQVIPGGYYKTIVSGAIEAFGWDMLLAAAADLRKFEVVLDSIFRQSLHHFRAWAATSIEFFICHDDMVWTQGPFMHPNFYRRVIFSRYAELWRVLHDAGKRILFCSDGNFTMFLDDIAAAGADGFIFEPLTSLQAAVDRFADTHVIISSKVDCRTLTFGTPPDIKREIDATLPLARRCKGFVFAVGNHIPANVPLDNATFYIDYLRGNWIRRACDVSR